MNNSSSTPVYGPTNPSPADQSQQGIVRYGAAIELIPEKEKEYRQLHAEVWPEVMAAMKEANIQNYNIFVANLADKKYLFSLFRIHRNRCRERFRHHS